MNPAFMFKPFKKCDDSIELSIWSMLHYTDKCFYDLAHSIYISEARLNNENIFQYNTVQFKSSANNKIIIHHTD